MKIALIAPIANLDLASNGDIHMALTQFVLTNDVYRNYYASQDKFKILDNGAYENALCDISLVLKAAEMIGASEIILPDIVFDAEKTLFETVKAIEFIKDKGLLGKYSLMAVVQGKNENEWWHCYNELHSIAEINTIGLSKLSCPKAFLMSVSEARVKITNAIREKENHTAKEIHLLGGSHQILSEIIHHPHFVRSIDTSAPFEYGRRRMFLNKTTQDLNVKADICKPLKRYNTSFVQKNINLLMNHQ